MMEAGKDQDSAGRFRAKKIFENVLDLALKCNDTVSARRLRYDHDPGIREALRMQRTDAALL
jgi:hypothetical protein